MFRKNFKSKIIVPTVFILVVLTVILTTYIAVRFLSYSNSLINEKVKANINTLKLHLHNSERYSKAAAVSMSKNPEVVSAVKNRDRDEILRIFAPTHELYQINFYTVTDDAGIVPARTYEPDRFGDSVLKHALRNKMPLSVLMIDVDKFKTYNDTYGYQHGDIVLQMVAETILSSLKRTIDFVARWGGEEFAVLLPNTDETGALHVAENIRRKVEKTGMPDVKEDATKVTVSIGVNTYVPLPESSMEQLIAKADEALYRAKTAGRNRVEI